MSVCAHARHELLFHIGQDTMMISACGDTRERKRNSRSTTIDSSREEKEKEEEVQQHTKTYMCIFDAHEPRNWEMAVA